MTQGHMIAATPVITTTVEVDARGVMTIAVVVVVVVAVEEWVVTAGGGSGGVTLVTGYWLLWGLYY